MPRLHNYFNKADSPCTTCSLLAGAACLSSSISLHVPSFSMVLS